MKASIVLLSASVTVLFVTACVNVFPPLCWRVPPFFCPQAISAACLVDDPDLADRLLMAWLERAHVTQVAVFVLAVTRGCGGCTSRARERGFVFTGVVLVDVLKSLVTPDSYPFSTASA